MNLRYTESEVNDIILMYTLLSVHDYWKSQGHVMATSISMTSYDLYSNFLKDRPAYREHYCEIIAQVDKNKVQHFTGAIVPQWQAAPPKPREA